MKRNWFTIIAGVLLVCLLLLYLFSFQVRFTEWAVLTTFGRAGDNSVIEQPGIYFKWPWPIQRVYTYDKRIQIFEDSFEETLTRDQKNVIVAAYVGWRVDDPLKFLKSVGTYEEAVSKLRSRMRASKNNIFTQYNFSEYVSTDPQQMKLNQMEDEILAAVQAEALDSFGIRIETVGIKHLRLPQAASEAVFNQMRERRGRLAERYLDEGQAKALEIKANAEAQKTEILAFAERLSKQIEADGQRAAQQYYRVMAEDERFAMFLRGLEFLTTALKNNTTFIFNAESADQWYIKAFRDGPTLPMIEDEAAPAITRP